MPSADYAAYTALMRENRFREAATLAETNALDAVSSPEFWLTQQSRALLRAGGSAAALEVSERALKAAPANGWALLAHAEALLRCGRNDEALSEYEAATANRQVAARAFDGLLKALERTGRWDGLLSRCLQGDLAPGLRDKYRARALAGLGRTEEAIAACRASLAAMPDDPQILWTLADLQVQTEGMETVLLQMGRVAKIPGKPPIYREIYASLCRKAGRHDAAAELYGQIAGTGDTRISSKQAFALARSGRESEAIPMLEELLRLDPDDFYVNSSYAGACARTGELERADRFYQELQVRFPDSKGIYGRLRKIRSLMLVPPKPKPKTKIKAGPPKAKTTRVARTRKPPAANPVLREISEP